LLRHTETVRFQCVSRSCRPRAFVGGKNEEVVDVIMG